MIVVRSTNCFVKKTPSFLPSITWLQAIGQIKKNGWDTWEAGRNVDFADAYLFFDIYLFCCAWDKGEWPFLLETSHGWQPKSSKTLSYLPLNLFFFCNFLVVPQGCLGKDTPVVLSLMCFTAVTLMSGTWEVILDAGDALAHWRYHHGPTFSLRYGCQHYFLASGDSVVLLQSYVCSL